MAHFHAADMTEIVTTAGRPDEGSATKEQFAIHWPLSGRPARLTDLPFLLRLEAQADCSAFILPWSRERHSSAMADTNHQYILFQDSLERPMGFGILSGITNPNHSIELIRLAAVRTGHGLGKHMLTAITKHAFNTLNAHRLFLDVFDNNPRARALYRSQGFVEEGVLREVIKTDSGYRSLVLMSMLRREFDAMHREAAQAE